MYALYDIWVVIKWIVMGILFALFCYFALNFLLFTLTYLADKYLYNEINSEDERD